MKVSMLADIQQWLSRQTISDEGDDEEEDEEEATAEDGYVALENLDTFRWTAEENPEMDLPPKPDNATTATVIPTNAPEVQGDSQQKDSTGGTPGGAALSQGRRRETVIPKHVVRLFLRSGIEYIYIYMYLTLIFSYDRGGSILCS